MKIRVFSLMWGTAWERYGANFASSFAQYWPSEVELVVVADRQLPLSRGRVVDLTAIPGVAEFRRRWKDDLAANGKSPMKGPQVDDSGYSWRMDAVKWMPQAMAPLAVLGDMNDGDILIWFDADVVTTSRVEMGWPGDLVGDADIACLKRGGRHTEIGFYGVRISPRSKLFLERFAGLYDTDKVFKFKEWHSAFVFDRAMEVDPFLRIRNLSPGGKGHVWPATMLSEHTVHLKGKRKDLK